MEQRGKISDNAFTTANTPTDITKSGYALEQLNKYLNGNRNMSPYDISKVLNKLEAGVPLESIIEWRDMHLKRTYGKMSEVKNTIESPSDLINRKLNKLDECIGGN